MCSKKRSNGFFARVLQHLKNALPNFRSSREPFPERAVVVGSFKANNDRSMIQQASCSRAFGHRDSGMLFCLNGDATTKQNIFLFLNDDDDGDGDSG